MKKKVMVYLKPVEVEVEIEDEEDIEGEINFYVYEAYEDNIVNDCEIDYWKEV